MEDMALLKENYKFYDLNRDAVNEGHIGDFAFIRDCAVVAYFKDRESAYDSGIMDTAEEGTFILHQCLPEEEDYDDIGCHVPTIAFEIDWR